MVTAGLKWAPETWPNEYTITAITKPWAKAIWRREVVCAIARLPKKTNAKVPMNSAIKKRKELLTKYQAAIRKYKTKLEEEKNKKGL